MADEPTIPTLEAAVARLRERVNGSRAEYVDARPEDLRTLLASHASLEERVKGFERVTGPFVMPDWSIPEGPGWSAYKLKSGDLRALAAFVNEKES